MSITPVTLIILGRRMAVLLPPIEKEPYPHTRLPLRSIATDSLVLVETLIPCWLAIVAGFTNLEVADGSQNPAARMENTHTYQKVIKRHGITRWLWRGHAGGDTLGGDQTSPTAPGSALSVRRRRCASRHELSRPA
jgi:hypothetical protein